MREMLQFSRKVGCISLAVPDVNCLCYGSDEVIQEER